MIEKNPKHKTEFFWAIIFLFLAGLLLVSGFQGKVVFWRKDIPLDPWQSIAVGIILLGLGLVCLTKSMSVAYRKMVNDYSLKSKGSKR